LKSFICALPAEQLNAFAYELGSPPPTESVRHRLKAAKARGRIRASA